MIQKLYYLLTAYIPRQLPQTQEQFEEVRAIMIKYYGLEDDPKITYTLAAQLMAGKPTSLRRSYGAMANATKKLGIAKMVQDLKSLAVNQEKINLEAKSKASLAEGSNGSMPERAYDIQTDVSVMQSPEGQLVS